MTKTHIHEDKNRERVILLKLYYWKLGRAISRPFVIAIRAARLYTAWLRYRSYVVIGLKSRIPTILLCLLSSARSFARSKQDEVALLRRQGSFRTLLTSSCRTRPYL